MMTTLFQITSEILAACFLSYGMDIRHKQGARDFVAPIWQTLMKLCSFSLVGVFVWITLSTRQASAGDWLYLAVMTSGTAFVVAAKHQLGKAHTFTGQYLEKPKLVTGGVYTRTRNPLYFGVLQCEVGASLFVLHQTPILFPEVRLFWLSIPAIAVLFAAVFNWNMAVREAQYLRRCFGEEYSRYSSKVPFIFPLVRPSKEA